MSEAPGQRSEPAFAQQNPSVVTMEPAGENPLEKIEELLTCSICLERYKTPKLLPCQHTFCLPCLDSYADTIQRKPRVKCPECRAEHTIDPYEGVKALPNNYTMCAFLEIHLEASESNGEALDAYIQRYNLERCKVCDEKAQLSKCAHCERRICQECGETHIAMVKKDLSRMLNQVKRLSNRVKEASEGLGKGLDTLVLNGESTKAEITEYFHRYSRELKRREEHFQIEVDTFVLQEGRLMRTLKDMLDVEYSEIQPSKDACKLVEAIMSGERETNDGELAKIRTIFVDGLEYLRTFQPDSDDLFGKRLRFTSGDDSARLPSAIQNFGELLVALPQFANRYLPLEAQYLPRPFRLGLESETYKLSRRTQMAESEQHRDMADTFRSKRLGQFLHVENARSAELSAANSNEGSPARGPSPMNVLHKETINGFRAELLLPQANSSGSGASSSCAVIMASKLPLKRLQQPRVAKPNSKEQSEVSVQEGHKASNNSLKLPDAHHPEVEVKDSTKRPQLHPDSMDISAVNRRRPAGSSKPNYALEPSPLVQTTNIEQSARRGNDEAGPSQPKDREKNSRPSPLPHQYNGRTHSSHPPNGSRREEPASCGTSAKTKPRQASGGDEEEDDGHNITASISSRQRFRILSRRSSSSKPALTCPGPRSKENGGGGKDSASPPGATSGAEPAQSIPIAYYSGSLDKAGPRRLLLAKGADEGTEDKGRKMDKPHLDRSEEAIKDRRSRFKGFKRHSSLAPDAEASQEEEMLVGPLRKAVGSSGVTGLSSAIHTPFIDYSSKQRPLLVFGRRGSQPGEMHWPRGIASMPGGEFALCDSSNHRVQVYSASDGRLLRTFGSYGTGEGQFDSCAGIAYNRFRQQLVVTDRYNHRVQIFDLDGNFVKQFGCMGTRNGQFNNPWGVALDELGLIFVVDKDNHRVQIFDQNGNFMSKFGSMGEEFNKFNHPLFISIHKRSQDIFISDSANHRICVYSHDGSPLTHFGGEGFRPGELKLPRGVAVDDQGFCVVADSGNNRIQVFSKDGRSLKLFGAWGSAHGQLKGVEGVALLGPTIVVSDRENHRVQLF